MTLEEWFQQDESRRPTIWQQFEDIERELAAERESLKHKSLPPNMIVEDGLFLCDMIRAMKQELDRHREKTTKKRLQGTPESRAAIAKRLDAAIAKSMSAFHRLRPDP